MREAAQTCLYYKTVFIRLHRTSAYYTDALATDEGYRLSDIKLPGLGTTVHAGIRIEGSPDGKPTVSYRSSPDLVPPRDLAERLEWVRKSYERFIEKVLEKEALLGDCLGEA